MHKATRIFVNGKILTMDKLNSIASAIAIKGNRILAVGTDAEIRTMAGERCEIIDLEGKTLLPGFYEAHAHFTVYADAFAYNIDCNSPPIGTCHNFEELFKRLEHRASVTPEGHWIKAYGFDDTMIAEKRFPTRHDLDTVTTAHPVLLKHISGHLAVLNTPALKLCGITKDTVAPEGSVIRREPGTNEPNGVLEETVIMQMVSPAIPPYSDDRRMDAFVKLSDFYASKGTTTAMDAFMRRPSDIELLHETERQNRLNVRVVYNPYYFDLAAINSVHINSSRITRGGVKLFHDGSIQGFTAYLTKPYHTPYQGNPDYVGYPTFSKEKLNEIVMDIHKSGWQSIIHTNGDAATDDVLDAYAAAQKACPRNDTRHLLIHAQTIREDQLDRLVELGVLPSFFTAHVYYWGDRHNNIFLGPERTARQNPLRSALNRKIISTSHLDCPVTPLDPFLSIAACVNRTSSTGKVYGPEQRVSVLEALQMHTINAAYQNFEEKDKGSIEPGKLADLIVLDTDPLTCAPEKLAEISVLETVLDGETVFTA